jgi:diaminopimelate epimerase
MKEISFEKYQATGNDFVMIHDPKALFPVSDTLISALCHRRFGIGADGLILIRPHHRLDFEMVYFNPDGSQSLCGNGSRCAVAFAHSLGIIGSSTHFMAHDGPHEATLIGNIVRLKMNNVLPAQHLAEGFFLDTGSPHLVRFVTEAGACQVKEEGAALRYSPVFAPGGTNVNFVEITGPRQLYVRTYERGVENETFSCGTGVTAAALAASSHAISSPIDVRTRGGDLTVEFQKEGEGFKEVYLIGPALQVFSGKIPLAGA